jgi:CRP-like cAMP-binding protein
MGMKLLKRRKNDAIYSQGEEAEMVYLLLDGELKMTKEINLFKENPNDFYIDRRRLVRQIHNDIKPSKSRSFNKNEDGVLHFANLTTLYNYRPVKKSLEIGLISSFGMFGEEELVFHTKRQATIQVNSIEATFYEIEFKKILEIIGPKTVDKFKEILEFSLSKKVLYRQHEFAEQVDFQNRTNLNYFYLDEGTCPVT